MHTTRTRNALAEPGTSSFFFSAHSAPGYSPRRRPSQVKGGACVRTQRRAECEGGPNGPHILGRSISRGFPEQLLRSRVLGRRLPAFAIPPPIPGQKRLLLLLLLMLLLLSYGTLIIANTVHARPSRTGSPARVACPMQAEHTHGCLRDNARSSPRANQPHAILPHRWLYSQRLA